MFQVASIKKRVLSLPAHEEIFYESHQIPDLASFGFEVVDIAEPHGQIEDLRLSLRNGSCLHARNYGNYFGFHWDYVDPLVNPFEHLRQDSPITYLGLCGFTGAAIGGLVGKFANKDDQFIRKSMTTGATLGLIFGLLTAKWD